MGLRAGVALAAAILLAHAVSGPAQSSLDLMDIDVERNAYGRQLDSRVAQLNLTNEPNFLEAVFIRAPIIRRTGEHVRVLACDEHRHVSHRHDKHGDHHGQQRHPPRPLPRAQGHPEIRAGFRGGPGQRGDPRRPPRPAVQGNQLCRGSPGPAAAAVTGQRGEGAAHERKPADHPLHRGPLPRAAHRPVALVGPAAAAVPRLIFFGIPSTAKQSPESSSCTRRGARSRHCGSM